MDSLISLLNQKTATPGKRYDLSGDTFNLLKRLIIALWRLENVGDTSTVRVLHNGLAGALLNGSAPSVTQSVATPKSFQEIGLVPVDGDTTGDSGYTLTLQPGVVNANVSPTVGGTYMWQLISNGAMPPVYALPTLTVYKGDYVYLGGTVAGGYLTDCIVTAGSTDPSTLETDGYTTKLIGTVDPSTGAWVQAFTGNLLYTASAAYWAAGSRLVIHTWQGTGGG
jgi:hypothetical protein